MDISNKMRIEKPTGPEPIKTEETQEKLSLLKLDVTSASQRFFQDDIRPATPLSPTRVTLQTSHPQSQTMQQALTQATKP